MDLQTRNMGRGRGWRRGRIGVWCGGVGVWVFLGQLRDYQLFKKNSLFFKRNNKEFNLIQSIRVLANSKEPFAGKR